MSTITVRASSLSGVVDCPRRYVAKAARKSIEESGFELLPSLQNAGSVVGTAVHNAAHAVVAGGTVHDAIQAAVCEVDEAARGIVWTSDVKNRDAAIEKARILAGAVAEAAARRYAPDYVEVELAGQLGGVTLTGHIDYTESAIGRISDLKTGKKGDFHAQLGAYALLAAANGITKARTLEIMHGRVVDGRGVVDVYSYDVRASVGEAKAKAALAGELLKRWYDLNDPEALPCNTMSFLCGPNWCPAYGTTFCAISNHLNKESE